MELEYTWRSAAALTLVLVGWRVGLAAFRKAWSSEAGAGRLVLVFGSGLGILEGISLNWLRSGRTVGLVTPWDRLTGSASEGSGFYCKANKKPPSFIQFNEPPTHAVAIRWSPWSWRPRHSEGGEGGWRGGAKLNSPRQGALFWRKPTYAHFTNKCKGPPKKKWKNPFS